MYVGVVVVIIQVAHPLTHSLTHIRRQGRTEINCNRAGINIIPITDRKVAREAKDYCRLLRPEMLMMCMKNVKPTF